MIKINNIKLKISNLTGIKKYIAAFLTGTLMTLAMPPIGAFYILLICVPVFIILTESSKTKKDAFLIAWAFGAGYFIFGLYWISFALFVDIKSFYWVLPLSAIIGPVILALFYGFIPLIAWRYKSNRIIYGLMIIISWSSIEWVRGHIFTGFPWNLIGYSWEYILPVMQINSVVGIYGLTFLTLIWSMTPLIENNKIKLAIVLSFIAIALFGIIRLNSNPTKQSGNYTVRIIQANIAQNLKWDSAREWENLKKHIDLTLKKRTIKKPISFVIWPETSISFNLNKNPNIKKIISEALPDNSIGIFGSLNSKYKNNKKEFFNSVTILNKKSQILGRYNKHHLVPFGEYIPFRKYLNMTPIANGIANIGDFNRGKGVSTIDLKNLPNPSPLICYEAIFPGEVADNKNRPDWLVNVTNDAWYGNTSGPYQHFEISRVRAIEEGLPLVRAANSGISATIDPMGRIISSTKIGEVKTLDTILPKPINATIYSQIKDVLFFILLIFSAIIGEFYYRKNNN